MRYLSTFALCGTLVLLAGCARQISPHVYSERSVGEVSQTFRGKIISVRDVQIEGKEKLEENTLGMVAGALGGGLIGNQFGGGSGKLATTMVGAAAGAAGGALAQKELEKQNAIEYTVQLSNGTLKTLVQGPEPRLSVGQAVLLMTYDRGRSRIVADQGSF